jgi:rare lipoprotein A
LYLSYQINNMNWIYLLVFLGILIPADGVYQRGKASYYAQSMNGRRTASGQIYCSDSLTAAHARLPFGTRVAVRNLKNDSTVVLRITDRMSASSSRVIDVSWAAAKKLNFVRDGLAQVELTLIDTIPLK